MILYDQEVLDKLVSGLETLNKAVSKTMGPLGRNVLIERIGQAPEPTKDGATVARYIRSKDQFEQMAIDMGVQIAKRTEQEAGDGTSGTIAIATALVREGAKHLKAGVDVYALQDQMQKAVAEIKEQLVKKSQPVDSLDKKIQIATIAANNNPEIGKIVGEMVDKIGLSPIDVRDGSELGIFGEVSEGMEVSRGAISPRFLEDPDKGTTLEDVTVLIFAHKLTTIDQIEPALARLKAEQVNTVLIIADGYSDTVRDYLTQASTLFVFNTPMGRFSGGPFRLAAIENWGWGAKRAGYLLDACALTGARVIEKKPEDDWMNYVGIAEKVIVGPHNTKFLGGADTSARVKELEAEINQTEAEFDKNELRERIGKLTTGIGVIRVAAPTESAVQNLKKQLDDTIRATQSAVEMGALPGSGTTLLDQDLSTSDGEAIVLQAIRAPFETITTNANLDFREIEAKTNENQIYNVKTKQWGKPFEVGVIDPTKVILAELTNSLDLAKEILAVAVGIVHEKPSTPDNTDHSDS